MYSYYPDFISEFRAERMWATLRHELNWLEVRKARREYWTNVFNQSYTYGSGPGELTYEAQPTHDIISKMGFEIAKNFTMCKGGFEGCFLNAYDNSIDALGWHADDDPFIDHTKPIAIITLYAERDSHISKNPRIIQFKENETGEITELDLDQGSLLMMHPGMQSTHMHRIPKVGFNVRPRISLTYRGLIRKEVMSNG